MSGAVKVQMARKKSNKRLIYLVVGTIVCTGVMLVLSGAWRRPLFHHELGPEQLYIIPDWRSKNGIRDGFGNVLFVDSPINMAVLVVTGDPKAELSRTPSATFAYAVLLPNSSYECKVNRLPDCLLVVRQNERLTLELASGTLTAQRYSELLKTANEQGYAQFDLRNQIAQWLDEGQVAVLRKFLNR